MEQIDRYGVVELSEEDSITNFKEKTFYEQGLINGGVYVLNVRRFLAKSWPSKFSFEKEFLETRTPDLDLTRFCSTCLFY